MAKLSPDAQAVLDAANKAYTQAATVAEGTAAALRAAADQVVPPALEEEYHYRYQALPWDKSLPLKKMVEIRQKLNAIAAELEAL